eukprot:GHVN01004314.1.p1 GENE.GHVN01004314.1~~GHVN01004314.1.p1  ORF type:complete len:477 (-),score=84.11 GHVN01004314.1:198-1628(-)
MAHLSPHSTLKDVVIVGAGLTGLTAAISLLTPGPTDISSSQAPIQPPGSQSAHELSLVILEKSTTVGGRLATRRMGEPQSQTYLFQCDTGAQFFTCRSPEFISKVSEWVASGLVAEWSRGWGSECLSSEKLTSGGIERGGESGKLDAVRKIGVESDLASAGGERWSGEAEGAQGDRSIKPSSHDGGDGFPRYIVTGGMNRLAKSLSEAVEGMGGEIVVNSEAVLITVAQQGERGPSSCGDGTDCHVWRIEDSSGRVFLSRSLIFTQPVTQALNILKNNSIKLIPQETVDHLSEVRYGPCLAGLFVIREGIRTRLPPPGALQRRGGPRDGSGRVYEKRDEGDEDPDFPWIADNQLKGVSPGGKTITIHASPAFSERYYDRENIALEMMRKELKSILTSDNMGHIETAVIQEQLKKWRYAVPVSSHPDRSVTCLGISPTTSVSLPIVFGGDGFGGGGRVEGAWLSGRDVAKGVRQVLY